MGYKKIKRPLMANRDVRIPVQTLSSDSTGTLITNYGLTTIYMTTAGTTDVTFKLDAPKLGERKQIMFSPGGRTVTFTCTAGGTDPFANSTNTSSLVATSNADDFAAMGVIDLIGVTALKSGATGLKWGVTHMTTAITIT